MGDNHDGANDNEAGTVASKSTDDPAIQALRGANAEFMTTLLCPMVCLCSWPVTRFAIVSRQ